ncbi:HD domain-containing protein [Desulfocicer niacini]
MGLPRPRFYGMFARQMAASQKMLQHDSLIQRMKKRVYPLLENDFGHGIYHSERVCVDGAAIVQVEMALGPPPPGPPSQILRNMQLIQIAGLLHDTKRKEPHHAEKGALFARQVLKEKSFDLPPLEIDIISTAIEQHEAFQILPPDAMPASLISNALYDADKFRWGPDNFTHTVWDMVIYQDMPIKDFLNKFPTGMDKMVQISKTFRTDTGRRFGPDFINIGIQTGSRLFKEIQQDTF